MEPEILRSTRCCVATHASSPVGPSEVEFCSKPNAHRHTRIVTRIVTHASPHAHTCNAPPPGATGARATVGVRSCTVLRGVGSYRVEVEAVRARVVIVFARVVELLEHVLDPPLAGGRHALAALHARARVEEQRGILLDILRHFPLLREPAPAAAPRLHDGVLRVRVARRSWQHQPVRAHVRLRAPITTRRRSQVFQMRTGKARGRGPVAIPAPLVRLLVPALAARRLVGAPVAKRRAEVVAIAAHSEVVWRRRQRARAARSESRHGRQRRQRSERRPPYTRPNRPRPSTSSRPPLASASARPASRRPSRQSPARRACAAAAPTPCCSRAGSSPSRSRRRPSPAMRRARSHRSPPGRRWGIWRESHACRGAVGRRDARGAGSGQHDGRTQERADSGCGHEGRIQLWAAGAGLRGGRPGRVRWRGGRACR
jgi:hypothetical protein